MNYEQIYKSHLEAVFRDECHSITRAIMYVRRRFPSMPKEFRDADSELSEAAKNEIILSILEDDEIATRFKLCRL